MTQTSPVWQEHKQASCSKPTGDCCPWWMAYWWISSRGHRLGWLRILESYTFKEQQCTVPVYVTLHQIGNLLRFWHACHCQRFLYTGKYSPGGRYRTKLQTSLPTVCTVHTWEARKSLWSRFCEAESVSNRGKRTHMPPVFMVTSAEDTFKVARQLGDGAPGEC